MSNKEHVIIQQSSVMNIHGVTTPFMNNVSK